MGIDVETTWVVKSSIREAVGFICFRFCLSACNVSFLFLPFAECGIRVTTPGVAMAAFGIEAMAMCSGLVRVVFKKRRTIEREPKE